MMMTSSLLRTSRQTLGSVQVLHQHFWGGLSQIADTTDALDGQNDDMLTLRRPGVGKLKHRARIAEIISESCPSINPLKYIPYN